MAKAPAIVLATAITPLDNHLKAGELAARFAGGSRQGFGSALFAEQSGLNVLRVCYQRLSDNASRYIVILDNVHRLDSATIRAVVEAAPCIRFLFLAQPWESGEMPRTAYNRLT